MSSQEVLYQVSEVIEDRKMNPQEGSYTNYLFDKGLDKILKKVGEEATETIIAAKNHEKEEIVYEIADLIYHLTVLMAVTNITWDDILSELARRELKKGNLKLSDKPEKVTDDDVEQYIQSQLTSSATTTEVTDRAAQKGDTVDIAFAGTIDGKAFDGGSSDSYSLELGSGKMIDGFEDSIIGHNVGETFVWDGKFPDDYKSTDLAGKACQFTITVNSISEQNVPELTDEWVANNSKSSKTVKEYKKEIKKTLEDQKQEDYDSTLKSEAWQAVVDNTTVQKYSKKQQEKIDEMKNSLIDSYKSYAESQGTDYETYITSSGQYTVESFEQKVEEAAQESEKQTMIAEAIADKEKIKLDDKTYKKMLKEYAKTYGFEDGDAMEEAYSKDTLKEAMLTDLVKDWLVDNCIQKTDN